MATAGVVLSLLGAMAAHAGLLDAVRARGHVECGVSDGVPGLSTVDASGRWSGLDVEFCAALAAATLGRADAVKYRPLSDADRFKALARGDVDLLARNTAWTLSRDTELGVRFVDVLLYDGQGFLVPRTHALASALELSGARICVQSGTHAEAGLAGFFAARKMRYQPVVSERWSALVQLYAGGQCSVLTGDLTVLASERSRLANPTDHVLLPELISKEPLAPAVGADDSQWFAGVRWTRMALVAAEELGITSANAEALRASGSEAQRAFLGAGAPLGSAIGLAPDWAFQVVRQVGNYGEIFSRNLGSDSPLALERRLNDLWSRGGLMYAPPVR